MNSADASAEFPPGKTNMRKPWHIGIVHTTKTFSELSQWMSERGANRGRCAFASGYVPVSVGYAINEYRGKYGSGYTVHIPNLWISPHGGKPSTKYHCIVYYIVQK